MLKGNEGKCNRSLSLSALRISLFQKCFSKCVAIKIAVFWKEELIYFLVVFFFGDLRFTVFLTTFFGAVFFGVFLAAGFLAFVATFFLGAAFFVVVFFAAGLAAAFFFTTFFAGFFVSFL